jgi:hypothetical protein
MLSVTIYSCNARLYKNLTDDVNVTWMVSSLEKITFITRGAVVTIGTSPSDKDKVVVDRTRDPLSPGIL